MLSLLTTTASPLLNVGDILPDKTAIGWYLNNPITKPASSDIKAKIESLRKEIDLDFLRTDVKDLIKIFGNESIDTITCNPPYFKISESSNLNDNRIKSIARHEILLNLDDIFNVAKVILKNNGNIAIVHRSERLCDIISCMRKNCIEPKKIRFVYPKVGRESNIVLIEGIKNGNSGVKVLKPLYAHDEDGNYSKEVKEMFS